MSSIIPPEIPKDIKDDYWAYLVPLRVKRGRDKNTGRWLDDDQEIWKALGKPLFYKREDYTANYEVSCAYCEKPLAMWHGSPDLSATDVCCFNCWDERKYGKEEPENKK